MKKIKKSICADIGTVLREPFFAHTVIENIGIFDPSFTLDDILRTAKILA